MGYVEPSPERIAAPLTAGQEDRDVNGLIVSMNNRAHVDEYVRASGQRRLRRVDARLLRHYVELNSPNYCRPACNTCESSCP